MNIEKLLDLHKEGLIPNCLVEGWTKRTNVNPIEDGIKWRKWIYTPEIARCVSVLFLPIFFIFGFIGFEYNYGLYVFLSGLFGASSIIAMGFCVYLYNLTDEYSREAGKFGQALESLSNLLFVPIEKLGTLNLADRARDMLLSEASTLKAMQADPCKKSNGQTTELRKSFKAIHKVFCDLNLVEPDWTLFFNNNKSN